MKPVTTVLSIASVLLLSVVLTAGHRETAPALQSAQRDASALPEGAGKPVVQRMCGTGCHGIEWVTPHRESQEDWTEIVDNMISRGAKGTEEESNLVIAYLSEHFGRDLESAAREPAKAAPASKPQSAAAVKPPGQSTSNVPPAPRTDAPGADWPLIGRDAAGLRFSPLTQITAANVAQLQLAWKYETQKAQDTPTAPAPQPRAGAGDAAGQPAPGAPGAQGPPARPAPRRARISQVTPVVVDGMMYMTSPYNRVVALEPETGKEIWTYEIPQEQGSAGLRSLAYWAGDGKAGPAIFVGTTAGYLLAIDVRTGKPVSGFGRSGALNLRAGAGDKFPDANFGLSSPPVFFENLVITGAHVQEQPALGPSGDVRAWDARTGKLVWTFHTIPRPGEAGHETWQGDSWKDRSGGNVWGLMTVDVERALVFLPLGTVTYDYYGGDRPGANLYGDTLVALDARSGTVKWHFQTTHHDVWDYDLNAAPILVDVKREGKTIPAVAQITKQSLLFILDRTTGVPIYEVEERPVPQEGFVESERPWPTQPFPVKPPPLARATFGPHEIAKVTPEHQKYCEELLRKDGGIRTGGLYLPFGEKPSVMFPGTLGGVNWHGASVDPTLGYLFAATMSLGEVFQIVQDPDGKKPPAARRYKFWDADKFWPCSQPPWGELVAVDVNSGDIAWRVPLGAFEELEAKGVMGAGTPVLGGPMATAGGVLFVGGTLDDRFRAFESRTGKELWSVDVGAAVHALPMTYLGRDGKQYVAVMVSGGGFLGDHTIPPVLMVFAAPGAPPTPDR